MSATRTCPSCGYSGTYVSSALADVHHPRHPVQSNARQSNEHVAVSSALRIG